MSVSHHALRFGLSCRRTICRPTNIDGRKRRFLLAARSQTKALPFHRPMHANSRISNENDWKQYGREWLNLPPAALSRPSTIGAKIVGLTWPTLPTGGREK